MASETGFKIDEIGGDKMTPPVFNLYLYATKTTCPLDNQVTVTATYQQVIGSGSGNLRTAISQVGLPLAFFVGVE